MLRKMLSLLILLPCITLISSSFLRAQTIYHPEKLGPQDYNFTTVDSPGLYQEVDNGKFVTWVNNSGLVSQSTSESTATSTPLFSLRMDGKSSTCLEPPTRQGRMPTHKDRSL